MKTIFTVLMLMVVAFTVPAMAADAAPAAATAPSFMAWLQANTTLILGLALAISELLAAIPAFNGNGILDTIIKALQALSAKPPVE